MAAAPPPSADPAGDGPTTSGGPELAAGTAGQFGPDVVLRLNSQLGELNERMGVTFLTADRQRLTARMPVAGNRQPAGLLHGGANAVLAESLGSMHAFLVAPAGTIPVGIELSCTHHRSATKGDVVGTCTPLHVGRTLATFSIDIRDESDRAVCSARLTCMFLPGSGG